MLAADLAPCFPVQCQGFCLQFSTAWTDTWCWVGGQAQLRLLREGQEKEVTVQLVPFKRLIPHHIHGRVPPYFIIAGLVFTQVRSEWRALHVTPILILCSHWSWHR